MSRLTAVGEPSSPTVAAFGVPGFQFRLVSDDPDLADRFDLIFSEVAESADEPSGHVYTVRRSSDGTRSLSFDGFAIAERVNPDRALAVLEWHATRNCLAGIQNGVAVHAAAVELGGKAVLLAGPSGSGKTTITLSLLARGASFISDEAVFVKLPEAAVSGLPRALALKAGRSHWIKLPDQAGHGENATCEVEGTTYLAPGRLGFSVVASPIEPAAIVLLQRTPGPAALWPLSPGEAVLPILEQVFPAEPEEQILESITALLRRAPAFRLTGDDVVESTETVERLFHATSR